MLLVRLGRLPACGRGWIFARSPGGLQLGPRPGEAGGEDGAEDGAEGSPRVTQTEFAGYMLFAIAFQLARTLGKRYEKNQMTGDCPVSMSALNSAVLFKEVFMAYCNAAILEPILTIAGEIPDVTLASFVVNMTMLLAMGYWISILTDAFDTTDIEQEFAFQSLGEEAKKDTRYAWFQAHGPPVNSKPVNSKLSGSMYYDAAFWVVLLAIVIALVGRVTHRAVFHAWMLLILWAVLHHKCLQATNWGHNYLLSFLLPSAALGPLEFCLPMRDHDSLERLAEWRQFVDEQSGVKIIVKP